MSVGAVRGDPPRSREGRGVGLEGRSRAGIGRRGCERHSVVWLAGWVYIAAVEQAA